MSNANTTMRSTGAAGQRRGRGARWAIGKELDEIERNTALYCPDGSMRVIPTAKGWSVKQHEEPVRVKYTAATNTFTVSVACAVAFQNPGAWSVTALGTARFVESQTFTFTGPAADTAWVTLGYIPHSLGVGSRPPLMWANTTVFGYEAVVGADATTIAREATDGPATNIDGIARVSLVPGGTYSIAGTCRRPNVVLDGNRYNLPYWEWNGDQTPHQLTLWDASRTNQKTLAIADLTDDANNDIYLVGDYGDTRYDAALVADPSGYDWSERVATLRLSGGELIGFVSYLHANDFTHPRGKSGTTVVTYIKTVGPPPTTGTLTFVDGVLTAST